MNITLKKLQKLNACREALREFEKKKLTAIDVCKLFCLLINEDRISWADWLLKKLLNKKHFVEYLNIVDDARVKIKLIEVNFNYFFDDYEKKGIEVFFFIINYNKNFSFCDNSKIVKTRIKSKLAAVKTAFEIRENQLKEVK
jgi:hypothetical protein